MQRILSEEELSVIGQYASIAKMVKDANFLDGLELAEKILKHQTSDGKPYVEPKPTEDDAKDRRLVMVCHMPGDMAKGPFILIRVTDKTTRSYPFIVEGVDGGVSSWPIARLARPEEIAKAEWREVAK